MQDDKQPETPWEFKPGDTISPGDTPSAPAGQATPEPEPAAEEPTAESPAPSQPVAGDPILQPQPPDESGELPEASPASQGAIAWTASEFIAHSKSINWYLALGAGAVAIAAIVFLLTRDKISSAVVLVAAAALGTYGARQPRQLEYGLNDSGLSIGGKFYPYEVFRSFAVMDEDAFSSIAFLPLKRFGQLTTIYFDPKDEDAIINLLSQRLPLEPRQHDAVDRFMKRIKF